MKKKDYKNYNKWMTNSFYLQKRYDLFYKYFNKNYFKFLPRNKDASILEVACGMGQFLYFLRKKGYTKIHAFDLDSVNVHQCHKLGFKFVEQGNLYKKLNQFKDEMFDVIIMNDIIEHIPREKTLEVLETIKKKLKPEGILIIKTVNCNNVYGISSYFSDFTHLVGYTSEKIRHVGMLSGFKNITVYNLYLCSGFELIDFFFKILFIFSYKFKRIFFILNGRLSDNVFSKNILAILKK